MIDDWIEFVPTFAPHVHGAFTRRVFDPETRLPEPQRWRVTCGQCGQSWQGECMSGQPKQHVNRFAVQHIHRDPLAAQRIERPGSRRVATPEKGGSEGTGG